MLEYLVTSQSRRALLKLLHLEGKRESVSRLAKLVGVSFSTAYAELRAMELAGFAKSEYVGKRVFFRANENSPNLGLLKALLRVENSEAHLSERVLANLGRMSGALGGKTGNQTELSDEKTLALAFKLARQNATVARTIPIALYRYVDSLDFEKLKNFCLKEGEKKILGFFLDLTSALTHQSRFHDLANELYDNRFKKTESFFMNQPKGKYAKKLESLNTPVIAKRWHFKMNMDFENFRSHFEKFANIRKVREDV